MCGICGIVSEDKKASIAKMINSIRHRGPDHQDYYTQENLKLGHARLSILAKDKYERLYV